MRQFHFDFYFFYFLDRNFSKWFSGPFVVHSRPSFLLEPNFNLLLVLLCPHAAFDIDFLFFNSRTAIAGLLLTFSWFFLFRRRYFYDHLTSQPLQICFLFIRSCNFNWTACVTSFFVLSRASFFVHLRDQVFGHTWLTSLSKMTSSLWNWLLFSLIQRDKVKSGCVTLNESYLRAANRGSKYFTDFNPNITCQPSMKRRIFGSVFLRLQIYEAIAAIFWQSASYVFKWLDICADFCSKNCCIWQISFDYSCIERLILFWGFSVL